LSFYIAAFVTSMSKFSQALKKVSNLSQSQIKDQVEDDLKELSAKAETALQKLLDETRKSSDAVKGPRAAVDAFKQQLQIDYDTRAKAIEEEFEANKISTAARFMQKVSGQAASGVDPESIVSDAVNKLKLRTPRIKLGAIEQVGGSSKANGLDIYIAVVATVSTVCCIMILIKLMKDKR
jgi:hypothetical protein